VHSVKTPPRIGEHAVVIGGSIGGLLAARVLSDHFARVTIVERDEIPGEPVARKCVPQGRHVHALFGSGVRIIERLYPGFFDELVAAGAVKTDFARDLCWFHHGVWKLRTESGLDSYWQTRPFLEALLRRRTYGIRNVVALARSEVLRLLANTEQSRIAGVEIQHRNEGGRIESLPADLVVDAGGRGSRLADWLESLGYAKPKVQTVEVNIGYASRFYERPEDSSRDWQTLATFATPPARTRSCYLFPVEGGRWLATLVGYSADYPPADERDFREFAESLETPDFFEAIKDARHLSPISTFQFPAHRWHRYDCLKRFPDGLIALGDAICSFNPVYGQGMSVCALETELLAKMLNRVRGSDTLPRGFARRFFRGSAKLIATPWLLATMSDFLFPKTRGRQSLTSRLLKRYVVRVFRLCATNRRVLLSFYRVLHLLAGPHVLFHPYIMLQVLKSTLGIGGPRASRQRPPLSE
jgi:2-polyprenyl-6-methoxyphenol hydroxylase-like FAD-dependent oxidoreductase